MNYQEMSDEQINHAVSDALSIPRGDDWCNSWEESGPIVSDNNISLYPTEITWIAGSATFHVSATHENPLRAAMIVFLMMKESA
ncbi:DUF2591 family protein [Tatumella sp. JGM130]|uniref:phage protein NinX family protein n=1 Tax=Tatumella sp. JGM130 TaxID=2799797 RepID=UPI001BB09994|nr:phage protein NinX family protein [Tatumella sp. JGM130]MBS0895538.1 DUF2591 family protein [Tatumella sp. JGM130]